MGKENRNQVDQQYYTSLSKVKAAVKDLILGRRSRTIMDTRASKYHIQRESR